MHIYGTFIRWKLRTHCERVKEKEPVKEKDIATTVDLNKGIKQIKLPILLKIARLF